MTCHARTGYRRCGAPPPQLSSGPLGRENLTPMILKLDTGKSIHDPNDEEITGNLRELMHRKGGFAILDYSQKLFIQTTRGSKSGFLLEWHDLENEKHFQTVNHNLDIDEITRVFLNFCNGQISFPKELEFVPIGKTQLSVSAKPFLNLSWQQLLMLGLITSILPFLVSPNNANSQSRIAWFFLILSMAIWGYTFLFKLHPWIIKQIKIFTGIQIEYASSGRRIWKVKAPNRVVSELFGIFYHLVFLFLFVASMFWILASTFHLSLTSRGLTSRSS